MDEVRARYLRDRVMTATPAQRVVMIYDRLVLDVQRAREAQDAPSAGPHLSHAVDVVAELLGSLNVAVGGPADNLAQLYGYLISQLIAIRTSDERERLDGIATIVGDLRDAFATATASLASTAATAAGVASAAAFANPAPAQSASLAWVG